MNSIKIYLLHIHFCLIRYSGQITPQCILYLNSIKTLTRYSVKHCPLACTSKILKKCRIALTTANQPPASNINLMSHACVYRYMKKLFSTPAETLLPVISHFKACS